MVSTKRVDPIACSHDHLKSLKDAWLADELHEDLNWMPLWKQARDYSSLECDIPENRLAEWIVFHAQDFKQVYDKHCTA